MARWKILFKAYTFEELVEKLERWYDFKTFYTNEEIKT
ncbi:MAG: FecR domain-containing protein [Butyricimonas faecihominis]